MEGSKIVPFPGPEKRVELARTRARRAAEESGAIRELYPPLDLAKVVGIQRFVQEERISLPFRFTEENFRITNSEVEKLTAAEAINELNTATEAKVKFDPMRFIALIELLESRTPSSQDDE